MNKLRLNQLIDPSQSQKKERTCLFCHPLLDICVFFLPFLPKKENLYKTEVFNPTSQLMTQKTTHPWRFQSSARWMLGSAAFADAPRDVRIPTAGRPGIDGHGHLPRPRLAPSVGLGVDFWSYLNEGYFFGYFWLVLGFDETKVTNGRKYMIDMKIR